MTTAPAIVGLLVVCLGMISAPLDSAVNIAFPDIARHFGRDVPQIRWIVIAYVLTYSSLLLVFGKLGDLIGYRVVFQIGLAICATGLAACALAPSYELLKLGRVLQGVGVALVLSCAPALATTLYPESERTRVLGVYAGMIALGGAIGPLAGGLLVERLGWTVVFWARIPLVLAALAFSWLIPPRPGQGVAAGLDPLGSMQLVAALTAVTLGLTIWDERTGPLLQLGLVALGAVMLTVFLRRQSRQEIPIIRPALFRDPMFSMMNGASLIANLATFSVVLIGPFYLLGVARLDAAAGGVVLALGAVGTMIGSGAAPTVLRRLGGTRTAVLGLVLLAAGLLGIATWGPQAALVHMALPLMVQGLGLGLFQVAYTDLVTATLPLEDRGVAGSLTMLTRTMGIMGGAVGLSALHAHFERTAIGAGLVGVEPFMAGFRAVFLGSAGLLLVAAVAGALAAWRLRMGSRAP